MSEPYRVYIVCDRAALHPAGKDSWTVDVYERSDNPHVQRWQRVGNPAVVPSEYATPRRNAGALLAGNTPVDLNTEPYVGKEPVRQRVALTCRYCGLDVPLRKEKLDLILDAAHEEGKHCLRLHALGVALSER